MVNGIHDMGGMHGFGPVTPEENEPVFHHEWEGRVYAMSMTIPVPIPGGGRYTQERMDPALYLTSTYYERWLYVRVQGMITAGVFTQAEYDDRLAYFRGNPSVMPPQRLDPELAQRVVEVTLAPVSHRIELDIQPAFKVGDTVRARNVHPGGHTRQQQYVRGKLATVVKYYGIQTIADTSAEVEAEPLYAVRFDAKELWGESAEPNCAIYTDMWESYLESV